MDNMLNIENNFVDILNLYQAANSDAESVKNNFVIRVHEFETIIDALKSKKGKDPVQHELILGRRGSGKSTLLKRIEIELNENKKLSENYIPVYLAEEQAGIYRLSDLWFESLNELKERENIRIKLKAFSEFTGEQAYTRYLFDEINKLLLSVSKKAVLLLDNLDRILNNLKHDGHLLRELLLNFNNVQIIGGSTRMDEHFWKYDQPFYEFFRQHKLESLSFDEIDTLLNLWSGIMKIPQLKNYAIKHKGKIEAIRILTDGLPRTLQFFIKILLSENRLYGFQYIRKIMDQATPLYQERLNNLTAPQRKIVSEMAFAWEAVSTRQLVDVCRMESKLISAYLKQLISFGIVKKTDTKTKNKLYRISERFFNMWLIVTQGNPDQKRKAKYLTIFLENWYDADKIRQLANEHISSLRNNTISSDKAIILTKAYSQSKYISCALRDMLVEETYISYGIDEKSSDLPEQSKKIIETARKYFENQNYNQAISEINKIENEEDGVKYFYLGYIYYLSKTYEKSEKHYLLAIEKGQVEAMFNLAFLYNEKGEIEKSEKHYLLAIENGHANAMNNLANLYKEKEEIEKAEKYYLLAIEKGQVEAMYNLAVLYREKGEIEKSEKHYLLAIEKGHASAMNNLVFLYFEENRNPSKALELIQKCNNINSSQKSIALELLIKIWNGVFKDIDKNMEDILTHDDNEDLSGILEYLLVLGQKNLLLSYFESEKYGKDLQDKYILFYYVTLILNNKMGDKILKIPSEVMPTVDDILKKIKAKAKLYSG
ncbi:MAG: tetratricopeptide repeat protein [Bacteroidota bacterium]|nr:tetratricopeptide repeat protein [Bacteroidota bacterium]